MQRERDRDEDTETWKERESYRERGAERKNESGSICQEERQGDEGMDERMEKEEEDGDKRNNQSLCCQADGEGGGGLEEEGIEGWIDERLGLCRPLGMKERREEERKARTD